MKRTDLKVAYKSTADLIPYVNNARTHSDEQITQIASSIKEFGFNNPILVDGENGVIAGHGRLMAAKKLGMEQVPTIELAGLSEAQKKAYIIADNKIALNAGWDNDLLKIELDFLADFNINPELVGFAKTDLEDIFAETKAADGGECEDNNPYTTRAEKIQYEPSGDLPSEAELIETDKADELTEEIKQATGITAGEKDFLLKATCRHLRFNYKKIADYYCNASPECQKLMEKSALVIIDFEDAVKYGYVRFSKDLQKIIDSSKASKGKESGAE